MLCSEAQSKLQVDQDARELILKWKDYPGAWVGPVAAQGSVGWERGGDVNQRDGGVARTLPHVAVLGDGRAVSSPGCRRPRDMERGQEMGPRLEQRHAALLTTPCF